MDPSKKNTSRVAASSALKAKSMATGGAGATNDHLPHPDVLIKDVEEGLSSPPSAPGAGSTLMRLDSPPKANSSKCSPVFRSSWTNNRRRRLASTRRQPWRDVTVQVQNQLIAQIEILQRSQSTRNPRIEGSRNPLSLPPSTIRAARIESNHN